MRETARSHLKEGERYRARKGGREREGARERECERGEQKIKSQYTSTITSTQIADIFPHFMYICGEKRVQTQMHRMPYKLQVPFRKRAIKYRACLQK